MTLPVEDIENKPQIRIRSLPLTCRLGRIDGVVSRGSPYLPLWEMAVRPE